MTPPPVHIPVLLHIPHASTEIPSPWRETYFLTPDQLAHEHLRLVDMYTDELYQFDDATRAVFPVSRFLVDPERFADDEQESMAARGMGALYHVTTDLTPLRPPPDTAQRTELMDRYYHPHHKSLDAWADAALASPAGRGLLVDCHSYPSKTLPYEMENSPRPRPQICIGTDNFHTPSACAEEAVRSFRDAGYEVGLNSPFAGTLVPSAHYGKSKNIHAFMIEIRKDLYMNEQTGEKIPSGFARLQSDITCCIARVTEIIRLL